MAVLENLEPKKVFEFFEQMSAIPRGSYNTKAISDYLANFARERGLEYYHDALNNVIIIVPATEGYENAEAVIIQGHMDMVCQKAPDCMKDMEKEGLDLAVGEGYIYAKGTTLGADDGIAVAMGLALADSDDIPHPRVELVLTVDEETGMEGATGIDVSPLKAVKFLNIDSEAEGIFTVSCAGGARVECVFDAERESFAGENISIDISGLSGGHSGIEIIKGRANPNILMGRLLYKLACQQDVRLISVYGGDKDNAIPTASTALLCVEDAGKAIEFCTKMEELFKAEYAGVDDGLKLSANKIGDVPMLPMGLESSKKIISFLCCVPNGVQAMSADIEGLVQTSLNLGILTGDEKAVYVRFSVRSSIESQKEMLFDRLRCLAEALGGTVEISGNYPGWAYRKDSPLRELMVQVYKEQMGKEPVIEAIHAGLECGLFLGKRPDFDCISFGPDITDIHTFREKLWIESTQRTWELLKETLKRIK